MTLVAKLVHQLRSDDLTVLTEMARCMRQFVLHGASTSSLYVVPIEALANSVASALAERARAGASVADVTPTLDFFHAQVRP
jgi:replicative superfamily II helicase